MEIESLSPMMIIEPKGSLIHKEEWELFDGIKLNSNDENEIDKVCLVPHLWKKNIDILSQY